MRNRAAILGDFGLPNRPAFEIEPHQDDQGIWRIRVSYEGDPAIDMSQGHATSLAVQIRSIDSRLAEQIDACLAEAKDTSGNSN